jgi:hypothetical protein
MLKCVKELHVYRSSRMILLACASFSFLGKRSVNSKEYR